MMDFSPSPRGRDSCFSMLGIVSIGMATCLFSPRPAVAQGVIERIREDVRVSDADRPAAPADAEPSPGNRYDSNPSSAEQFGEQVSDSVSDSLSEPLTSGAFWLGVGIVAAPLWAPHALLGDDFSVSRSFARFPYRDDSGYMVYYGGRSHSAQFSADYATEFNDLDSIGGRLVFDTASRFGIDAEAKHFRETLPRGRRDDLHLGDCNLTFRFAQNEKMQWRTGLGINWMDDPQGTDVGFNFTYGFDWFPRKPWVASMQIDWGTLGRSGLFHFRGTVGALFDRFEAYTGYEYYDFDRVQTNMLIGGVRVWF